MRGVRAAADARYGDALGWSLIDAVADADVVHVHQVFTHFGEVAAVAARVYGRALCITDHGGTTSTAGRRLGLIDLAGAAIAYSRFGAAALGRSSNILVIEGGVDAQFFCPAEPAPVRDRIVFAGRIMPHKGVDALIRACPGGVPLTIAGTVPDAAYFADVRRLAAGADVTFVIDPDDKHLRELYRRALAVVLPSRHVDMYGRVHLYPELMGLTSLEGMACGAPAIVTRTGGLPEYVDDGVTGFVVDSDAQLAVRIEQLASDPALVRRMGDAARTRLVSLWDIAISGRHLLAVYRRLLAE